MAARQLICLLLLIWGAHGQAEQALKLPRTAEDYRTLATEEHAQLPAGARVGVVLRVSQETQHIKGQAPAAAEANPTLATVPGKDLVHAEQIKLNQGAKQAASAQTDRVLTRYRVVLRWEDGSLGERLLSHDPGVRKGERVAVTETQITRLGHGEVK